jgi:hypothetical protein
VKLGASSGIPGAGGEGKKPGLGTRAGNAARRLLPGAGLFAGATLGSAIGGGLTGDYLWNQANDWQKEHPGGWKGMLADAERIRNAANGPYADSRSEELSAFRSDKGPGWEINNKTTPWPMVGAGGATAGAGEAPQYIDATTGAMNLGASQAGSAGQATGSAYQQGLIGPLQETLAQVQSLVQQIMGALDFSVHPNISATGSGASAPPQRSSMTNYDHLRAASGDISHFGA